MFNKEPLTHVSDRESAEWAHTAQASGKRASVDTQRREYAYPVGPRLPAAPYRVECALCFSQAQALDPYDGQPYCLLHFPRVEIAAALDEYHKLWLGRYCGNEAWPETQWGYSPSHNTYLCGCGADMWVSICDVFQSPIRE